MTYETELHFRSAGGGAVTPGKLCPSQKKTGMLPFPSVSLPLGIEECKGFPLTWLHHAPKLVPWHQQIQLQKVNKTIKWPTRAAKRPTCRAWSQSSAMRQWGESLFHHGGVSVFFVVEGFVQKLLSNNAVTSEIKVRWKKNGCWGISRADNWATCWLRAATGIRAPGLTPECGTMKPHMLPRTNALGSVHDSHALPPAAMCLPLPAEVLPTAWCRADIKLTDRCQFVHMERQSYSHVTVSK